MFEFFSHAKLREQRKQLVEECTVDSLKQIEEVLVSVVFSAPDQKTVNYAFEDTMPEDCQEQVFQSMIKAGWRVILEDGNLEIELPDLEYVGSVVKSINTVQPL